MNRRADILIVSMLAIVFIASLSACSDEIDLIRNNMGSDEISFFIDNSNYSEISTRANENCIYPSLGLMINSKDSVYFHTDVTNYIPTDMTVGTRGIPVGEENFTAVVNDINVDAYINGVTPYFLNYKISKQNSNTWIGSDKKYWPKQNNEKLNFYCSAMLPNGIELNNKDGETSLSYAVPHSADNSRDAEAQHDLLFRNVEYSYDEVKTLPGGNVPLKMRHALAAISFNVGDFTKGKIKSITIKNARQSGNMSYHEELNSDNNEFNPVFEWNLNDELTDFKQTFNISVEDQTPTSITETNPSATFMLLPQDLEKDEVEFSVEFEMGKGTEAKTIFLSAPASKFGSIKTWEAGKHYVYTLSSSSINWTYVFGISNGTLDFYEGNQEGNCVITSYRYRTGNPSKKEIVGWTAEAGKAKDAGNNEEKLPAEWIQNIQKIGNGSIDGENCDIVVKPNRLLRTSFKGDEILRGNDCKGSPEAPYDLSLHSYDGSSINKTTANCYVVNSVGTYSIPAVYGNAYNDANINNTAITMSCARDITGGKPEINGIHDAVILWMDGLGIIDNVKYDSLDKKVVFSIKEDQIQQANAVIAVRNANQEILWSWHIWVYEKDLWKDTIELEDFDNSSVHYNLMNNNLGRCDAKTVYYDQREGNITFIQDGTGTKVNLSVILHEFNVETTDINSTLYQWGRKDPFTSVVNISKLISKEEAAKYKTLYPKGGEYLIKDAWTQKSKSMKESICNPHELYKDNNNSWMSSIISDAWSATKTIFDPCPMGFRVPEHEVFKIFCIDGENHTFNGDPKYKTDDNGNKVLDKNENPIIIGYTTLTTDVGKQRLNEYLNGEVISVENEDDVRHYNFYRVRNGKGDDDKFELISTGMRPFSGTSSNFNSLVLWSCNAVTADQDNALKNSAYAFKVGYEGEYLIQPTGSVIQANVYPIRPISENSTSGTNP